MAEIISKDDLIGNVQTVEETTSINTELDKILSLLDKIQSLLSNPLIQQFLAKFFPYGYDLYGNPITNPQELQQQKAETTAEEIYNKVLGAIETLISTLGDDVKLGEVRQYMIDHKEEVVKQIKTFLGM